MCFPPSCMTDKYFTCKYARKCTYTHWHTQHNIRKSPDTWAVRSISGHRNRISPLLFLIFLTDLLSLDGFQVLSCLSAPRVTFSKLYIQNEIPSLQECAIWEWSQNLEDTFPTLRGFSNTHWDMQCMIYFFSPLPILLPHCFFIVIPHFTSHSTSNIGPRFQFVVWPFLSYILQQSANSAVLLGLPGKVHLSSSE